MDDSPWPAEIDALLDDSQKRLLTLMSEAENAALDNLGRCYELTTRRAVLRAANHIVHGTICLPNRHPIDHAWIVDGDRVWEPTLGRWVDREWHRWLFDATPQVTYTTVEAAQLAHDTGHHGPWHDTDR